MSFRFRDWLVTVCSSFFLIVQLSTPVIIAPAKVFAGPMTLLGAGSVGAAVPAGYTGLGDIVTPIAYGSCANVLTAALATTATSMCDLVAITGGAVVCTLRGSSTGAVDLAASYCAGTTPAAACAAASGGSCKITKIYDQTGGGHHWTQVTLASMPTLTFSALNGLPGITCSAACVVGMAANVTAAQPFSTAFVYKRTGANTSLQNILSTSGGAIQIGPSATANALSSTSGAGLTLTGTTDGSFHAAQTVTSGTAAGRVAADSLTPVTGSMGANSISAQSLNLASANGTGAACTCIVMEAALVASDFTSNISTINSNAHTRYAF